MEWSWAMEQTRHRIAIDDIVIGEPDEGIDAGLSLPVIGGNWRLKPTKAAALHELFTSVIRDDELEKCYAFNADFNDPSDRCAVCGYSLVLERHHFVPRHRGGSDDPRNILLVCPTHHRGIHWLIADSYNLSVIEAVTEYWRTQGSADPALYKFYCDRILPVLDLIRADASKDDGE